jgi:hypothetical protein
MPWFDRSRRMSGRNVILFLHSFSNRTTCAQIRGSRLGCSCDGRLLPSLTGPKPQGLSGACESHLSDIGAFAGGFLAVGPHREDLSQPGEAGELDGADTYAASTHTCHPSLILPQCLGSKQENRYLRAVIDLEDVALSCIVIMVSVTR